MASSVKVNMRTCGKCSTVTAELQDDGDTIKISIDTNCPNVKLYADKLTEISSMDVCQFAGSKVEDPDIRASLSVPCMVPNAVFNAAWLELGMLSPNMAKKAKSNDNEFLID